MINQEKNTVSRIISNQLCVGCGMCLFPSKQKVDMIWDENGFLVPDMTDENIDVNHKFCPFNPTPDKEVRTETELAHLFLSSAPNSHHKIGKFCTTYVGYATEYRNTSSSGGIATYLLKELFDKNEIDAAITVGEGASTPYQYKIIYKNENLLATSKTKYYPVSIADSLQEIKDFEGRLAIVGVGCFIKSIRLLQYYYPEMRDKIVYTIGIICGGLKSKFFAEYLAGKAGVGNNKYHHPEFRIKNMESNAGDYSFGCMDENGNFKQIRMQTLGDMWGTGLFKCNACDFCDDVTSELADISLGDAWIPPYNNDGKGHNVIVTRSKKADDLIKEGIDNKKLDAYTLPLDIFLSSQQGSFNHRHKGLRYRMYVAKKRGVTSFPPKRHNIEKISLPFMYVQKQRMKVRQKSLSVWKDNPNAQSFDACMKIDLEKLSLVTLYYHRYNKIIGKIKKL